MILYRPCGACGELVPAVTGCKHWRPAISAAMATVSRSPRVRKDKDRQNELLRGRRAAKKAAAPARPRRQSASDAEKVAEFARAMGKDYR